MIVTLGGRVRARVGGVKQSRRRSNGEILRRRVSRWRAGVLITVGVLVTVGLVGGPSAQQRPSVWEPFQLDPAWSPEAVRPADHDVLWLTTHGAAAATGDCTSCHSEDSCASCHAAAGIPAGIHPAGYFVLHAGQALIDSASCTSCHTVTRFCVGCHTELELAGTNRSRPPAGIGVHPDDWLVPDVLVNHATEARTDLLSCAGCHDADTCVTCHVHVNPHGSAFLDRCAEMLDAAEPTCTSCHTATGSSPIELIRALPECQR